MWCDNCLLIFPLRAGGLILAAFLAVYQAAGGIILFKYGNFLYFHYPEWQIWGGAAMVIMALGVIQVIAFSNRSYLLTRLLFILWPVILILSAVRAAVNIFELQYYQDRIVWECQNGGQQWGTTPETASSSTVGTLPPTFCSAGITSLFLAYTISLAVDFIIQVYCYFMVWRFQTRLQHYDILKGGAAGTGLYVV